MHLIRRFARRVTRSRVLNRVAKPRFNERGDRLDPQVTTLLMVQGRKLDSLDVDYRRARMERSCFLGAADVPRLPTEERTVGGWRTRWYPVEGATHAMIYLHGGGWVVGSLETADPVCQRLARQSGRTVISVDYPLAPEHPWPAALHSLLDVWKAFDHERWESVALGGDSAGATLVAAAVQLLEGVELQFLIYPGLDATKVFPSQEEFIDERLLLERQAMELYLDLYGADLEHPLASPALVEDVERIPPTILCVAGFCPLRDEGLEYARRLRQAGVPVDLYDFSGLPHGFGNIAGLVDAAAHAMDMLGRALRPADKVSRDAVQ